MATVAEMRARLAAVKAAQQEKSNASQLSGIQVPKNELPQNVVVVGTPGTGDGGKQELAIVYAGHGAQDSHHVQITTDLQSTTLVVVERPAASDVSRDSQTSDKNVQSAETQLDTGNPVHAGFLQRLADLESCLLARDPLMKTHLGMIHKTMIEYEEIPNLLTVEEISKIMTAQQAHTGVVLRQETVKSSKSAATRKSAQIKLEDI